MSKEADVAMSAAGTWAGAGFGINDWAHSEELGTDAAIFAGAEDAGLGKELREGTFAVDKGLLSELRESGQDPQEKIQASFERVKGVVQGLAKAHGFNLGKYQGVLEFKAWLHKNKGAVKNGLNDKKEDEEKVRDEER